MKLSKKRIEEVAGKLWAAYHGLKLSSEERAHRFARMPPASRKMWRNLASIAFAELQPREGAVCRVVAGKKVCQ